MSPKGALTGQQGPDGRVVAGQGLGLCSRSQTLSFARPWEGMASSHLGPARVPVRLAVLEPPSEERDLGYFFWSGEESGGLLTSLGHGELGSWG